MTAPLTDNNLVPLIHEYWAAAERIVLIAKNKGISNTDVQTLATLQLGLRPATNSTHIACAAGLAANNFS